MPLSIFILTAMFSFQVGGVILDYSIEARQHPRIVGEEVSDLSTNDVVKVLRLFWKALLDRVLHNIPCLAMIDLAKRFAFAGLNRFGKDLSKTTLIARHPDIELR